MKTVSPVSRKRTLVVETADYWWNGGHDAALSPEERLLALVNAVNHTENMLIEVIDNPNGEFATKLRDRLASLRKGR